MKRSITSITCLVLFAGLFVYASSARNHFSLAPAAHAQSSEQDNPFDRAHGRECTLGALKGSYGFQGAGFFNPDSLPPSLPTGPASGVGVVTFDGAGNISATLTQSFNGTIIPRVTLPGSYTVNADCTGSGRFVTGVQFDFVSAAGGSELYFVFTNPGSVVTGAAKRL